MNLLDGKTRWALRLTLLKFLREADDTRLLNVTEHAANQMVNQYTEQNPSS